MKKVWFKGVFVNYDQQPPPYKSINRAFNQHKRHPISSVLWWKWEQKDRLDCASTWHDHHTMNQPKDIYKRWQNEIWTLDITHIKTRACRACQTKTRPNFWGEKSTKTELIVVLENGNGSAVNHQAQEKDWNQREELKKKIEDNDGRVSETVAEWWTVTQEGGGGAFQMLPYFCWGSSRAWRRTWTVACL